MGRTHNVVSRKKCNIRFSSSILFGQNVPKLYALAAVIVKHVKVDQWSKVVRDHPRDEFIRL